MDYTRCCKCGRERRHDPDPYPTLTSLIAATPPRQGCWLLSHHFGATSHLPGR
jgi:hypothetical protein